MSTITVAELIEFLQDFDPNVQVLINSDSGTPDPCHLPNHIESLYTIVNGFGHQQEVNEEFVQDYLDDGFKVVKVQPLLWPV